VLDFVLRTALDSDPSRGIMIKKGTTRRIPNKYLTDLDFADDIALVSDNVENAQIMISLIEKVALRIGQNLVSKLIVRKLNIY
jgi:hypothetical protein